MGRWVMVIWVLGVWMMVGSQLAKPKRAVVFCDVGQGDMVLVIDGWWQMVVDSGPNNGFGRRCFDRFIPWWDRVIEVMMVTHDDADHSGGIKALVAGLRIDKLISDGSYLIGGVKTGEQLKIIAGEAVKFKEIELNILDNPKIRQSGSDTGLVSRLSVGETSFWLMADGDWEVERMLVWRNQIRAAKTNVLKVSHHGSARGTSDELINKLMPAEAVISVGKNKYGHPAGAIIDRLESRGVKIRRTDRDSDVVYILND